MWRKNNRIRKIILVEGKNLKREEALRSFQKINNVNIEEYRSSLVASRRENKIFDPYIGYDTFEKNVDCWIENFDDQDTMYSLLANYTYIVRDLYIDNLYNVVQRIVENTGGNEKILENTFFVTFPSSKGIKSGGDNIRAELPLLVMEYMRKDQFIEDHNKYFAKSSHQRFSDKSIYNAECIVFFDDILGSGETAIKNIKSFMEKYKTEKQVRFFLVAMYSEVSVKQKIEQKLKEEGYAVDLIVLNDLYKCMSPDYIFTREEISEKEKLIRSYEEIVAGDNKKVVMGYDESQLLISFYYNTPNNTLCCFYKPTKVNFPLFVRNSYKRPTVQEIRDNRKKKAENAYELAKRKKDKANQNEV